MTSEHEACKVIITAPDAEWLTGFAKQLVADGLCAGAHNFPAIRSVFRWAGDIHDISEAMVALHTRMSLVPQIVNRVNKEHPYEVPGVAVLPIVGGNPAYLEWIAHETEGTAGNKP